MSMTALRFAIAWLALGAGAGMHAQVPAPKVPAETRPNVVLILADDLGYGELGCYGQEKIQTPHLDRLAAEGLRFTQAYSGAPVCAPSRCVLLTGKHTGHAEIRGNREQKDAAGKSLEGQHPLSAAALTLPELFQRAGYATAAFGKWGLGQAGTSGAPNAQGFELFFGVTCQRVAHSYYPRFVWRNGVQELLNEKPVPGHAKKLEGEIRYEDWSGERHLSSAVRDEALRWLAARKDDGRPFFLYLPFLEPHVAMQPERSFVERYPAEWDPEPYRGQCGYTPHPRPRAGYAAMISQLDDNVGRIVAALEAQGLAENTLIVFTSDNGTTHEHAGDPELGVGGVDGKFFRSTAGLRGRKGSVYEGGIRVPLLARWKGRLPANQVIDAPLHSADLLPTLCAFAGIAAPAEVDGRDERALFERGERSEDPARFVWVFPEYGGQVAVRFGDWKLLRRGLSTKQLGAWELYDLAADPLEQKNLATARPEIVSRGIAILREEVAPNESFPLAIPDLEK
jgi:arylsulfatase A-like enzyme